MCEKHFHEDVMTRGLQRVNPIPTKRGPHCGRRQLNEPNIELWGKPLQIRNLEPDQLPDFKLEKCISSNAEIEGKHYPPAFQIRKTENSVTFYKITRLCLKSENFQLFLKLSTLLVKLQINDIPVPLLSNLLKGVTQSW